MVIINAGLGNSVIVGLAGRTVASVLSDADLRSILGFGDNVQASIGGQVVSEESVLTDGDVVILETVDATKD